MQFRLDFGTDIKTFDEVVDGCFSDAFVGACEGFECFVGVGVTLATEDGLDGFCAYGPTFFKVSVDAFAVEK